MGSNVVVCGMGLGLDDQARDILALIRDSISLKQVLILDASALDLISQQKRFIASKLKISNFYTSPDGVAKIEQNKIADQNDQSNQAF